MEGSGDLPEFLCALSLQHTLPLSPTTHSTYWSGWKEEGRPLSWDSGGGEGGEEGRLSPGRKDRRNKVYIFKIILSIYYLFLFILAELVGLHCAIGFSPVSGSRGYSLVVLHGLLILRARGLQ